MSDQFLIYRTFCGVKLKTVTRQRVKCVSEAEQATTVGLLAGSKCGGAATGLRSYRVASCSCLLLQSAICTRSLCSWHSHTCILLTCRNSRPLASKVTRTKRDQSVSQSVRQSVRLSKSTKKKLSASVDIDRVGHLVRGTMHWDRTNRKEKGKGDIQAQCVCNAQSNFKLHQTRLEVERLSLARALAHKKCPCSQQKT